MGNSLALDLAGRPHISYLDDNSVKYARWTDGNWDVQIVDDVDYLYSAQTDLALDNSDKAHIAYIVDKYGQQYDPLRYAYWGSDRWITETVYGDVNHFAGTSIAVTSFGIPAVTYMDGTEWDLIYALRSGPGSWWIQSVSGGGFCSSLAFDNANRPHISYSAGNSLEYAHRPSWQWVTETVEDNVTIDGTSLALDSTGNPHISYRDEENDVVKYARLDGSEWLVQTVDSALQGRTQLALDSNDNPVICYRGIYGRVKCARWTGSVWNIQGSDISSRDFSLALDATDNPHLSFFDGRTADLKYAAGSEATTWLYLPLTLRGAVLIR